MKPRWNPTVGSIARREAVLDNSQRFKPDPLLYCTTRRSKEIACQGRFRLVNRTPEEQVGGGGQVG
jgi:hypothetical protein